MVALNDTDVQNDLENDINNCLFTPFLGAGASSLRPSKIDLAAYPWRDVAATLTAIGSQLVSPGSLKFLHSFAAQRLRLTDDHLATILPQVEEPGTETHKVSNHFSQRNLLFELQVELVRAIVRLTRYFGIQFSEESPAINQLPDCSVSFDPKSDTAKDALLKLFAAADVALKMQGAGKSVIESPFFVRVPGTQRCLDTQSLYQKLLTLIVCLLGRDWGAFTEFAKHEDVGEIPVPIEFREGRVDSFGKLRLDAVQWLSELLWYTLRYWVPCYPTTAELAFELSLAVRHAPPRRAELAQAAQALENQKEGRANKIVRDLVIYCETAQKQINGFGRENSAFYYSIVAVLQYQFEKYQDTTREAKRRTSLYKDRFKQSNQPQAISPSFFKTIPAPIAFTTNFDTAIEELFKANDLAYHIIFPMVRGGDFAEHNAPVWMLRTCYPQSKDTRFSDIEWKEVCEEGVPTKIDFEGPIIVKLHGSPSLERDEGAPQHWLVLSEVGYLRALGTECTPPRWLGDQLCAGASLKSERERSLWFLGYSISDWNVRLRLYEQCKGSLQAKDGSVRRSAVDRVADVYRTAILEGLEVNQLIGDLNYLPRMVLKTLTDDSIEKSAAVESLIQGLRNTLRGQALW